MTKRERVLQIFVCVMCAACTAFSLFFPKAASEAAFRALSLCAKSVVPSLFLFMAAAKILLKSGGAELFSHMTKGACEKIFNISKSGSAAVFFGILSGYPTGAVVLSDFISCGKMEREEAESILPFITAASPAFLVGAVGSSLFSSAGYGAVLLASQLLSSVVLLFGTRKTRSPQGFSKKRDAKELSFLSIISSSIRESGMAVISVCSFVTFFFVFSEMVLYFLPEGGKTIKALVSGSLEISGGFSALAGSGCSLFEKYFFGGLVLGFSGISVFMQSASALAESGVSMKKYVFGKAAQSLLCGAFSVILGVLYEKGLTTVAFKLFGVQAPKLLSMAEFGVIFALIFAVCAVFIAAALKILRFFSKKRENFQKTVEKKR